jgi:hypothetical protein
MPVDRVRGGYPRVRVWGWFLTHGFRVWYQVWFRVWFSTRGYPMDIRNKSFGIKTHVC